MQLETYCSDATGDCSLLIYCVQPAGCQVLELSRRVQGTPYQQQLQIIHGDFMKVRQQKHTSSCGGEGHTQQPQLG